MQIALWPIERVIPYDCNPRQNEQEVDSVAESLKQFGSRQPIVVDAEGVIVVGHTRGKAAKKLGLAQVPVHVATDLTRPARTRRVHFAPTPLRTARGPFSQTGIPSRQHHQRLSAHCRGR